MKNSFKIPKKAYAWIAAGVFASVIGLTAVEGVDRLFPGPLGNTLRAQADAATEARGLPDFVSLAKKLTPVVVNVSTTQAVDAERGGGPASPFQPGDPRGEFWRRFFGGPGPRGPSRQQS